MRVWDIHPGYLNRNSLLGQHAEIHALRNIIESGKKGYASHPETMRWKENLTKLREKHELTAKEMKLRGYRHASPFYLNITENNHQNLTYLDQPADQFEILRKKYTTNDEKQIPAGRIPLPLRGSDFWSHHKYSVMARGYNFYKEVQAFLKEKRDLPIQQEINLIELVMGILEKPVTQKALQNLIDHLWGYFKDKAITTEKNEYFRCSPDNLPAMLETFYALAQKYHQKYLLQSTIFADFI